MENKTLQNSPYTIPFAIVIAGIIIAVALLYGQQKYTGEKNVTQSETIFPKSGVVLPVLWGDLGAKLVSVGAIDGEKFKAYYEEKGQYITEYKNLLFGNSPGKLKITKDNAGYLLNLFWALGLASKNDILDSGEMGDPKYGGAENFASTAGWTMAVGDPMDHYNRHKFFNLSPEQQALVDKVSRGIYRPCCGNSTHFPDCNHGMAMLGLLELIASQGANEQEMWDVALVVNSYWFSSTYEIVAIYMRNKGIEWKDVNPQEILGASFSSSKGFAKIKSQINTPNSSQGGSGCGVGVVGSAHIVAQRQQSERSV